jgi:hypothetical protein
MRCLILASLLASQAAMAVTSQFVYVDMAKLKQQRDDAQAITVTGRAIEEDGEKGGQLRLYIRDCGKVIIPKNAKGDAPRAGQTITATIKGRCQIGDWR